MCPTGARNEEQQPQRHHGIIRALLLQQDTDQRPPLGITHAVEDLEGQVGLAAVPVVEVKLPIGQTDAVTVEAAGECGHGLFPEEAEIRRMVQRLANHAVVKSRDGYEGNIGGLRGVTQGK
jgi:hypothetical protein